ECRVHADRSIGRTRTAGDKAHARAAAQLAVRLRHESGAAFLPVDDEADLFAVGVKAVEDGQEAFPGHAKSVGRALRHQAFHNQVTGELAHVAPTTGDAGLPPEGATAGLKRFCAALMS